MCSWHRAGLALAVWCKCVGLILRAGLALAAWCNCVDVSVHEQVDVLEYFEDVAVRSARTSHMIPAVCRVRFYVKVGTVSTGGLCKAAASP